MRHLFLEGPIQTGKSTLIRRLLAPHLDKVAGFTSQRLVTPAGDTLAFRIGPADAPLTLPISEIAPDWPLTPDRDLLRLGIFKGFSPDGVRLNMDVFKGLGLDYISLDAIKKRPHRAGLVLLDEIGGHELTIPEYREALHEILSSGLPCLGVIKHPESTRRMDADLIGLNARLHDFIEKQDGRILYYDRLDPAHAAPAEELLRRFIGLTMGDPQL